MFFITLWVVALIVGVSADCEYVENELIGRGSITMKNTSSSEECCALCNANSDCYAFTFEPDGSCWLKDNTAKVGHKDKAISGTVGKTPPPWGYACLTTNSSKYKFCDSSLSISDRLNDLVPRISLNNIGKELTARESSTIAELGLPPYYWGTNAIHGVQNVGCIGSICPTSFPAPCALGATFNMSLVSDMGATIGRELRAYYNGKHHDGLDTWSPTINLNRDPRWGRNVEVPGESPYLSGRYGIAYARGLQFGPDDSVLQAVVTLKHWIAYSVESYHGTTRHNFDAKVSEYDLANSYFPAWEATIKEGKAKGVMCSYNMLNGAPTCGNPNLTAILREDWGFDGYITSDSDACADIYRSHHYASSAPLAVADCLKGGTDIDSGNTYKDNLAKAVTEKDIDLKSAQSALYNSYKMRFELGLFDPHTPNYYRNITEDVIGCPEHQAMSLLASRQAMTLLKNSDGILPFEKGKKVAVIGLSANTTKDLLGNYNGPICPGGGYTCFPTLFQGIQKINVGGTVTLLTDTSKIEDATKAAKEADYVILVASNSRDGGGEGHDRDNIYLSKDQKALCSAVLPVNKNTVLVLVNGGIIAIDELKEASPAILETFMPGVHGGQAIAETIFGDYNPGGKMPVTMYNSSYVNEIKFLDMNMTAGPGRSYRYYTGEPLFPFGFGLSYTTFKLHWDPQPPPVVMTNTNNAITYTVNVTNTGKRAGDEVVLAFFKPDKTTLNTLPKDNPVIIKQLFDFKRIHLQSGQMVTLKFTVKSTQLALVDTSGHTSLHPGSFDIIFTRGHGEELHALVHVAVDTPIRLKTFRKWW